MRYVFGLLLSFFLFSHLSATSQQNHFLYFQTENKQAFYIKLNNKIFSSSASGYLILPKLSEGNYVITFGFPKNEWPEQVLNYKLEKDAGFILKNFGEKGWGIFNLQSLNVIMATSERNNTDNNLQSVSNDTFSNMLANVVNDSTIKQKDIIVKEEVKEPQAIAKNPEPVKAVQQENSDSLILVNAKKDSVTKQKDDIVKEEIKVPQAIGTNSEPAKTVQQNDDSLVKDGQMANEIFASNSVITKNFQKKNKNSVELIYIDTYNNNEKDTIRILITADKDNDAKKNKNPEEVARVNVDTVINIIQDTTQPASSITQAKPDSVVAVSKKDKMEFLPATSGAINSNCRAYATEEDFLKLRKKMAAENNDDNMIKAAKKSFKAKCFTTQYVKNLASLFLKDEGKYNFFDAAYPYVSDSNIFYILEDQLSDDYYVKRFKAMIHP